MEMIGFSLQFRLGHLHASCASGQQPKVHGAKQIVCIMVRHISFDVLLVYLNKQWLSSNLVFLVE